MPGSLTIGSIRRVWVVLVVMVWCSACKDNPTPAADAAADRGAVDLGTDERAPDLWRDARLDLSPGPRRDWGGFPDVNVSACRDAGAQPTAGDAAAALAVTPGVKWTTATKSPFHNAVEDPGGSMYFTGYNGIQQIHGDGTLGWLVSLPPDVQSVTRPTVMQGTVVFGSDIGKVHGVYTAGKPAYSVSLDGPFDNTTVNRVGLALLGPGPRLYIGGRDDKLYAFDHAGNVQWRRVLPGPPLYTVMDEVGTLYAPVGQNVAAVDSSGKLLWIRPVSGAEGVGALRPTVRGGLVGLAATRTEKLVVELDRACGRERWRTSFSGYSLGGFLVGPDGAVYAAEWDRKKQTNRVLAFSAQGKSRWTATIEKSTYPDNMGILLLGPIGADGTLYVFVINKGLVGDPSGTAHLRAYSLSGTLKWKLDLPDLYQMSEPLLLKSGLLVFAAQFLKASGKDYAIMAIQTPSPGLAQGWPRDGHDNLNTSNAGTPLP